jgi:hypothetical protein
MRYFVPDIRLPSELPPQTHIEDKLGGLPWGLPADRWPMCSQCRKPQSLLAQFRHHSARLDLGREGRCLFVFQCNHDPGMCSSWEGGSGANACFVVEPETLAVGVPAIPNPQPLIERELRIVQWVEREDGLSPAQCEIFFDDSKWGALEEDEREDLFVKAEQCTRLGGVPHWIQSSGEAPADGWRFVGQLDSLHRFLTPPAAPDPGVRAVTAHAQHPKSLTYFCEGPNFGDAGIGYLFLKNAGERPEGWFFWQCS